MNFKTIFGKNNNVVIGALHLPPLPGYEGFPGFDIAIENAIKDAQAFEDGGVDGIIFENNYDLPHTTNVGREVVSAMKEIGTEIVKNTNIPVGVSVLWNDYRSAFEIASALQLPFIRIPVFVDRVRTSYGTVDGNPAEVASAREAADARDIALFTDIQVKHAELLTDESLESSARRAVEAGSDALIITGKWTGDAPLMSDIQSVRSTVQDFPIICGSGVDRSNAPHLFKVANGAIISTSLKEDGENISHDTNIKTYEARISKEKTRELIESLEI